MKIYKLFVQYFLFIYFVYGHDLNHADPVTVKQSESVVTIDTLSQNIDTSNILKNENENPRLRVATDILKSNEQQTQSPTPSVDILSQKSVRVLIQNDITTPSTTEQKSIPLVNDPIKNIPISNNDKFDVKDTIPFVQTQLKEESHIPSLSNSNSPDIKQDQYNGIPIKSTQTTTNQPSIVEYESHSTIAEQHQNIRIHPRHMQINQPQTEENVKTDVNQPENETVVTPQPAVTIDNKTQKNDQSVTHTDIPNPKTNIKSNVSTTKADPNVIPIENATTIPSFVVHDSNVHSSDENISQTTDNNTHGKNRYMTHIASKLEENNRSMLLPSISTNKIRQICWHLPKTFEPSIELLENEIFRFINFLPEFLQTIVFGPINDREVLMNTMWFCSICTMCFFFSFFFLSMGTKRLKQNKQDKEIRVRCQQLQQYNNQIELERATFERQNQKLTDEIDELKTLPVRNIDEDIFTLRTECTRFEEDIQIVRQERDTLQEDLEYKQSIIQIYEHDLQGQIDIVTHLNNEIVQLKQQLEKERFMVNRFQSNDLSLEKFEKYQEIIQQLKSEITQLKQEKFSQKDQLQEIQDQANKLDIENNQLTSRMKQLKDFLEQRNQIIQQLHEKIQTIDHFQYKDLLQILSENSFDKDFLSIIDNDIQKSSQHIYDLHTQINEKTCRIKELENLFKQEKDHCKEIETKLKIVLELRERDAHLHIRQLGQTDAELRKARTDTERVRILQQQLELKQQQLDDIQKILSSEQIKFNEECSKLQHEIHEKWMEVKRLTREVEASKKESEGLRRQITKYTNNERSSQEKSMSKPIPQKTSETENNGSSPIPYQQVENFRPTDHQRTDSGATSPNEMLIPKLPLFGLSPRPPFFPAAFLPPHPSSNPFIIPPRFPIPAPIPHGIISPIPHLLINNTELSNSEINDSSISTNYETQSNTAAGAASPAIENDKPKKPKKSLKKKSRTSIIKEDV